MTGLVWDRFQGVNQALDPRLLPMESAQDAANADVRAGVIEPLKTHTAVDTLAKLGTIQTIYRFDNSGTGYWFHYAADVDILRGPVPGDTEERTYIFGDGIPKYTWAGIATSGTSEEYPTNTYDLGVPAPTAAPTVAVSGTATDENTESRVYVYTNVSTKGEEGPPSPVSAVVDVKTGQTVDLSALETTVAGNRNVTHQRIYRTNTADSGTQYQFVAEITLATTAYSDSVASANLGDPLPSATWDVPPADLHAVVALPGGVFAGLSGNDVCFSEPYQPHAWPVDYRLALDYPGVGLGAYGNTLLVLTEQNPYLVSVTHPVTATMAEFEKPYACLSKRGVVDMGYAVLYPGADGLVLGSGTDAKVITESIISPARWRALKPSSILAVRWDDRYLGFYDTGTKQGGFWFDPRTGDFVFLDWHVTAAWTDPLSGTVYGVINNNQVVSFNTGAALTGRWKGKVVEASKPINLGAARIDADGYPVHLKVWADGVLKYDQDIASADAVRLPAGYRGRRFWMELSGAHTVRRFEVAETMRELRAL